MSPVLWFVLVSVYFSRPIISRAGAEAKSNNITSLQAKALLDSGCWCSNSYIDISSDHCQWPGITCDGHGLVTIIYLDALVQCNSGLKNIAKLNLSSFIPSLTYLDLGDNRFHGSIPSEIGMLSNLKHLLLYNNSLTGELPSEIGNLTQLYELDVSYNQLSGSIPPSLANLTYLNSLSLHSNSFTGQIPSEIGLLPNLQELYLRRNGFEGTIPSTIGLLSNLFSLYLSNNLLVSPIPSSIANLTQLEYLDLSYNRLDGNMPLDVGNLISLQSLSMSHNNLNGSIPSTFGLLSHLWLLDLSDNLLVASIPFAIGNLIQLSHLDLSRNLLDGIIPLEIGNLKDLYNLDMSHNNLNGSIPSSIGNLLSLHHLDLSWNFMSDEIPSEIGNLTPLVYLDLSNNNLSSQIPNSLSCLSVDQYLGPVLHFENNSFLGQPKCSRSTNKTEQSSKCYGQRNCFQSNRILYIKLSLPILMFIVLLIVGFLFLYLRNQNANKSIREEATMLRKERDLFSIWNFDGTIAFRDIIEATQDYHIRYYIGTGGYGSVYRAQLPTGKVVALKKLRRLEAEEPIFDNCFNNEIKMLTQIRHRNTTRNFVYNESKFRR